MVLVNIFQVTEKDILSLLKAWEADANWMKQQPGYISTQLHQGISGSTVFMNYAVWESVAHFRSAFNQGCTVSEIPKFVDARQAQPLWTGRTTAENLLRSRLSMVGRDSFLH